MSFRLTAIALAVLVVLGGVVWFSEFRDKGSGAEDTSADLQKLGIFKFDDKSATQLDVSRAAQKVTAQKDEQGNWTLQPGGQPGDTVRITSVLTRLANLQATRRLVDETSELGQYGLDNPSLTVTATLADGTTSTLQAGSTAPAGTGVYVKRATDSTVFIISTQLINDLQRFVDQPPVQLPTPTPAPIPSPSPSPSAKPGG